MIESYSNIDDIARLLTEVEKKHLPFAAARALTRLAVEGQAEVRRQLDDRFTIRKARVAKGIRIAPARGKRIDQMQSRVFTLDWFLEDQEEGAVRGLTPKGHRRAIPSLLIRRGGTFEGLPLKRARTLLKQTGKPRRKPLKSGRRRKPLPFTVPAGKGVDLIYQRSGDARGSIDLLYVLAPKVTVTARFEMKGTVVDVFNARFMPVFLTSLQEALAGNRANGQLKPIRSRAVDFLAEHGGFSGPVAASLAR